MGAGAKARSGGGARTLLRVRAAQLLVTLVAIASIVTGIANIGVETIAGPLGTIVPIPRAIQRTAGFTGALTGFLVLGAAYGLRRRLRIAWYMAVVLLPLTALQGVAQSSAVSLPLVALSLLSLPTVLVNRRAFDRDLDLTTTQLAATSALVGGILYGTVGTFVLREQFDGVDTLLDAFWFTIVTASTVGYGDVTPVGPLGKLFATSVLLLNVAAFAVALGTLLGPLIEARLARAIGTMSDSQLELLDDHVIVVGMSDLTEPIIEELGETRADFVVITRYPERATDLRDRGVEVLTADPSDEEPLTRAGIERAIALVAATDDDAQDAMAVLTARELNPELNIVAAATERENVKKLRRAGANTVLSPAVIGGHLLVQSALGESGMEALANRLLDVPDDGEPAPADERDDAATGGTGEREEQ